MSEKNAFEKNEVLLWGLKPVKKILLEQYDKGNKNPRSISKKKKEDNKSKNDKVQILKEFDLSENYGIKDLPFLNREYERIDKEMTISNDRNLEDLQEKLYELIEGLEQMKKIEGGNIEQISIKKHYTEDELIDDDFTGANIIKKGRGFKKGSPEASLHAEKMRKILEDKNKTKIVNENKSTNISKSRVVKGSEEAKALGRKLAEAKKKKSEEKKKIEEMLKKDKPNIDKKGKPWFYIGDIPKGYREATEDEAILSDKVSIYGKYIVDDEKYTLYKNYGILLSKDKDDQEKVWYMNGLKKRVLNSLKDIEILSSKLSNDKYKDKWEEYRNKLINEKIKRKYLQAGWNWYYKLYCEKYGKKFIKQKFELIEPIINIEKSKEDIIEKPKEPNIEKNKEKNIEENIEFIKGNDIIELKRKYFNNDMKLKPKYSKQLFDKKIILEKEFYDKDDYKNYIYHKKILGNGFVIRKPSIKKKYIIQSILFDKKIWNKSQSIDWLKNNNFFHDNIDITENYYRFRQYNPDDLHGRKYINKKFNNGIELIISIK